ncbi:MAG: hypothetical protein WCL39_13465 [Armatimonadota bacterium]
MKSGWCSILLTGAVAVLCAQVCSAPSVVLRDAPELKFPSQADSNSPVEWDGNTMYLFNSIGIVVRSQGSDLFNISKTVQVKFNNQINAGRWIECTRRADDGTLYGWYHCEPLGMFKGNTLTSPYIGAARSTDNGATWTDLGTVLEGPKDTIDPNARNGYFVGGNGDFSSMLDAKGKYLYLFFSTYAGDISEQGISVARMEWANRDKPAGQVWKYHKGSWKEAGIGGHISPVFTAKARWQDAKNDAFWGPSIHWNTHLKRYVMLLNHVKGGPGWPQEGIYFTYCRTLDDPRAWSQPKPVLTSAQAPVSWYPEVIGTDTKARETDKLCGQRGRLFIQGVSHHEIIFLKDGEKIE